MRVLGRIASVIPGRIFEGIRKGTLEGIPVGTEEISGEMPEGIATQEEIVGGIFRRIFGEIPIGISGRIPGEVPVEITR